MNVKVLWSNWFQAGSVLDRDGAGEDYTRHSVGIDGITSIEEEKEDGMPYSYLVKYDDGTLKRLFNPNFVEYFPKQENIWSHVNSGKEVSEKPEFTKDRENV